MLGVGIGGGVSLAFAFASTRGGGDSDLLVEETLESAAREHLGVAVANALASRVVRVDGARAEEFCARAQGDDAEGRVESGVERDDGGEDCLRATGAGSERSRRLGEGARRRMPRWTPRRCDPRGRTKRRLAARPALRAPGISPLARGHPAARVDQHGCITVPAFPRGAAVRAARGRKIRVPFCPK